MSDWTECGLIAQEVALMPEFSHVVALPQEDGELYKLDYTPVQAYLIVVAKELIARNQCHILVLLFVSS